MRPTKSEVDEVVNRLSELSTLIGVSPEDLLTFMRVLSKASWANVEFEPFEDLKFEFEGAFGGAMRLEITVRRGSTTIIKEYVIPEFFLKDEPYPSQPPGPGLIPVKKARRKARNKKSRRR